MRDIKLKATEYFEAAARLGTVTKAAAELGVSPSAVSQQIKLLETQFGVMLFRREKRRLKLTLDGDRLYQTTTQAFAALRNSRAAIGQHRGQRSLNLRVSPSFGVRWLGPRVAGFASQNPDWNIRINATPEFSEFDTEAIDLDLRYGLGEWTGLTVECVMQDAVLPLCSPDFLEAAQAQSDPVARLQSAHLIDSVKSLYRWELWLAASGFEIPDLSYPFRFGRSSMSIEMVKQDAGIEMTTGLLGQGICSAVGMAVAEARLAAEFEERVDRRTWAFVGDGCFQEGMGQEAISLAGHLMLGKLTFLWDDNAITDDGDTGLAISEDVDARFLAANWHVQHANRHDFARRMRSELPDTLPQTFQDIMAQTAQPETARGTIQYSGAVCDALAGPLPEGLVLCADLEAPTNHKRSRTAFTAEDRAGSYIHCGVREHLLSRGIQAQKLCT